MDLSAAEIEGLFEELGKREISVMIQIDQSLLVAGEDPWRLVISGPAVRDIGGIQIAACSTFRQCLENGLRELRRIPGDWEWMDIYL